MSETPTEAPVDLPTLIRAEAESVALLAVELRDYPAADLPLGLQAVLFTRLDETRQHFEQLAESLQERAAAKPA